MSSATRVHFPSAGTAPPQLATPGKAALNALSTGLQALHESLRDNEVITGVADKFMRLFIHFKTKESLLKKFDDETYVPTSCRIKVDLKGSQRISMSDKFAALVRNLKELTDKYKEDAAKVFLSAGELELKLIKQDLTKMVLRFANLLMKQKLLMNNDCRDHSQSHMLLTAVFIQEPRNHARIEEMVVDDTPGALEAINSNMDALRFDADDDFIYNALAIPPVGGSQPSAMTPEELELLIEIKKDLKNTLYRGIRAYYLQIRKIKNTNETKEILLESLTVDIANGTACVINNDDNNAEKVTLPNDVESLRDLIGSVMLEKMNEKKTSEKKSKADLKDRRGARGGGASSNTNTSTKKEKEKAKRKKKKAAAAKAAKKKAAKAAAADKDSVAVKSNKRRRPTNRSS